MLKEKLLSQATAIFDEVVAFRRHLHSHPELSFQEKETSSYIREVLDQWKVAYDYPVGGEGIVAKIQGKHPSSRHFALRADMDALPISEQTNAPYQSKNPGVMHACGHDVHSACLLGAIKLLHANSSDWEGTVTCVFQPAEEKLPGGASLMLKDGLFSTEKPEGIFGQHVFPELSAGKVGFFPGPYMASTDELYFTINGKGGHGAKPDQVIDPVLIAAHVVVALQQIPSRRSSPMMPVVLSIGKVVADGATNIIPSKVTMEGTFRTFDESLRTESHHHIESLVKGIAQSMGGDAEVEIRRGYPVVNNDVSLTHRAIDAAKNLLGEENVVALERRTTAEDFAYYTQVMPGCFYRLGTAGENGMHQFGVHHPQFDIEEKAMSTGVALMAWLAMQV